MQFRLWLEAWRPIPNQSITVGNVKLQVARDSETGEYAVRWIENGRVNDDKTYYGGNRPEDLEDTVGTMRHMATQIRPVDIPEHVKQLIMACMRDLTAIAPLSDAMSEEGLGDLADWGERETWNICREIRFGPAQQPHHHSFRPNRSLDYCKELVKTALAGGEVPPEVKQAIRTHLLDSLIRLMPCDWLLKLRNEVRYHLLRGS